MVSLEGYREKKKKKKKTEKRLRKTNLEFLEDYRRNVTFINLHLFAESNCLFKSIGFYHNF